MQAAIKEVAQKVEEAYLADELLPEQYKTVIDVFNHLLLKGSVKVKVNKYAIRTS